MVLRAGLISTVLLFGAASSAQASDLYLPTDDPYLDSYFDFSGAYVGVQVGGQHVGVTAGDPPETLPGIAGSGFVVGAHAGYNHQIDSFVMGLEGDLEYSSYAATADCPNVPWVCSTYLNWQGSVRARAGYAADATMFYLTGGLAVANFGGMTENGGAEFPDSGVRLGWTAGGGVEMALADNVSGRIEYRYSDFGARDMNFDVVYPSVHVTSHAVRLGVSFGM